MSNGVSIGAYSLQLAGIASKNILNSTTLLDPVSKLRVSNPENLIDTDFEYGLQTAKWENIELINNIPTFFTRSSGDESIAVTDVTTQANSLNIRVTTTSAHNFVVGSPFIIVGLSSITAEGSYVVTAIVSTTVFIYKARERQTATKSIFDSYTTYLYSGNVYQSTQYTVDNIEAMETDTLTPSKILVKTRSPNGFNTGTNFMLANSIGRKEVNFDASLVDPRDTVTNAFLLTTSNNVPSETGYKVKTMVPYDYQSKKTVFFDSSNVDLSSSTLFIPGHGLTTGTSVMYVAPSGDAPLGGLCNYDLYSTLRVDASNVQLRRVSTNLKTGLHRTVLNGYWGCNLAILTSSNVSSTSVQNNMTTGNDFVTNFANQNYLGGTNRTAYFVGYFLPNQTGAWSFRLQSEDAAAVWIGSNAVDFYGANLATRMANAVCRIDGDGTAVRTSSNEVSSLNSNQRYPIMLVYGNNTTTVSANLTFEWRPSSSPTWISNGTGFMFSDQFLMYRIVSAYWNGSLSTFNTASRFSEGYMNSFYIPPSFLVASGRSASFSGWFVPDETGNWSLTMFAEDMAKLWLGDNALPIFQNNDNWLLGLTSDTATPVLSRSVTSNNIPLVAGRYYPFCFMFGQTSTAATDGLSFALRLTRPDGSTRVNWFDYVHFLEANSGYLIDSNAVTLTSAGTSAFGRHALLKSYLVNQAIGDVNQSFQIQMNTTNYLDASLASASDSYVSFSMENGILGFGVQNVSPSIDNISLSNYARHTLSAPTIGASTTNITRTGTNGGPRHVQVQGKTWVVPYQAVLENDSFYRERHGLVNDSLVTVNQFAGTLPSGLVNGSQYRVETVSTNYFRLRQNDGPRTAVDIRSFSAATIQFSQTVTNPLADTIFSPTHDFVDGTEVVYLNKGNASVSNLTNGSTYYVQNAQLNTFSLCNASGPVNIGAVGSNTHTIVSVDRATDGNYRVVNILDPYTFEMSTTYTIPFNAIVFDPQQCVDLTTNRVRYPLTLNPQHRMRTGARVFYEANSNNAAIGGLADKTSYYLIVYNLTQFGFAASYSNAVNNLHIPLTNNGTGKDHILHMVSLSGDVPQNDGVIVNSASNVIIANTANIDFLSTYRLGDTVRVELPGASSNVYAISSVSEVSDLITFTSNHNLSNGSSINYALGSGAGTGIAGLSNGYFYYVSSPASNQVVLYNTPFDAINQTENKVDILGSTFCNAVIIKTVPSTMYISKVTDINSKSIVTVDAFPASSTVGNLVLSTALYPRSDGFCVHRPFDGGVEIVPSLNPTAQIIRQTRRNFRYQSGKGIQMSEAVVFAGSYDIMSLTRSGSNATAVARKSHRLTPGVAVSIFGATQAQPNTNYWNGTYLVSEVPDLDIFVFDLSQVYDPVTASTTKTLEKIDPNSTTAPGFPMFTVKKWSGAALRVGLFDDQNGIFFEYDGNNLYAVLRNSVRQLPGSVTVEFNSALVVGSSTKFNSQLQVGDYVVIRGMSYKVVYIEPNSDTRMYVQPPYRGISATGVIMSKTVDERYPSSAWSIDKCDGTGPSGYTIDVSKTQMVFIDYAWYGAGMVRYGFRMTDGSIVYCHEIVNNNQRNESYMRSGNLPGRFEVTTFASLSYVPSLMHWGTSVIMDGRFDDDRAYLFTAAGAAIQYLGAGNSLTFDIRTDTTTVFVGRNALNQQLYDYPTYSVYDPAKGRTVNAYRTFIRTVDQSGVNGASNQVIMNNILTFVKSGTVLNTVSGIAAGTTVVGTLIINQTITANNTGELIMYIDRKTTAKPTPNTTPSELTNFEIVNTGIALASDFPPSLIPLVSIRLAPSVDNGRPGALGSREVINRMQLTLDSVGILTTNDVEIKLLLNAYPFTKTWERVQPPSLSQLILHKKGDSVTGGVQFYSFRVSGGQTDNTGKRGTNSTTVSLEDLATLGNSILGGDGIFPNGPDLLTIGATIIDGTGITASSPASITGRITWTESQA